MKSIRETPRRPSDQAPVTFHDVAACFSEEEWKLLHLWQKELYKNVMKKIQHALISLGPLIATSVFSLKLNEKEDMFPMDHQDLETQGSVSICPKDKSASSEASLRKPRKASKFLKNTHNTDEGKSCDHPSTGRKVTTAVTSIGINEEGETYLLDIQDYRKKESINRSGGEVNMKRKTKDGDGVHYSEKNIACEASFGKSKAKLIHKSEKGTICRSQLQSESDWKLGEKAAQCAEGAKNNSQSSIQQPTTSAQRGDTSNGHWRHMWNAKDFLGQENEQNRWGALDVQSESIVMESITVGEHQGIQTELSLKEKHFQCAECSKSFSQKVHLIRHRRIHSGEKPYHCTECSKSFSHKHILLGHQRKHSGERPFQCTTCMKSFIWKEGLRRHQRTHTGHT